jgi:FkbM family methyltransferase
MRAKLSKPPILVRSSRSSGLFRAVNRINPTSYGRHTAMAVATAWAGNPPDGEYRVGAGATMFLRGDDWLDRAIYYDAFEYQVGRLLWARLRPGGVFVDVGANIGFYTLTASRLVGPQGRVIAFEPNPAVHARLKENLARNRATNVTAHACALSDEAGVVEIHTPTSETHGHASMRNLGWEAASVARVPARRLDEVLAEVERVDVLKADVEGAELLVFRGAPRTIRRFRPLMVVEYSPQRARAFGYDGGELTRLLLGYPAGYRLSLIESHRVTPLRTAEVPADYDGNVLFDPG